MLSEEVRDTSLSRVTPAPGKGALGTRRSRELYLHPDTELESCGMSIGTRVAANRPALGCE